MLNTSFLYKNIYIHVNRTFARLTYNYIYIYIYIYISAVKLHILLKKNYT